MKTGAYTRVKGNERHGFPRAIWVVTRIFIRPFVLCCFLPLTQEAGVAKELGTRHRAALGITEESNVMAIVVSEETGIISVAKGGQLQRYMTIDKLKEKIETIYGISPLAIEAKADVADKKKRKRFFNK